MTVALFNDVGKSCEAAVTVTVEPIGGVFGAVYSPAPEIVPNVEFPPNTPFTSQSTLVVGAPVTVDMNVILLAVPDVRLPVPGEMVTVGGGMIVTTEVTDNFGSSYDTAITLTVAGEGTTTGATYFPDVSIVPTVEFPPVMLFTCQVTRVFVPPETPA